MTEHLHATFVPGCFRCDLSRDEMERHDEGCCLDHDPAEGGCMTAAEMRDEMRLQRWEEERDDHLAR